MKATISADGRMTVKAENDLEQYALRKWWSDWQANKATFSIEVVSESDPNETEFKQVRC